MEDLPDEVLLKEDGTALGQLHRFICYDYAGTVVVGDVNAEYASVFPDIHALHQVVVKKDYLQEGFQPQLYAGVVDSIGFGDG